MTSQDNKENITQSAQSVRWDLSDLFSSYQDPKIKEILSQTIQNAHVFLTTYRGKIHTLTAEQLKTAYISLEALISPLYQVSQFVNLVYATDTANHDIKALVSHVDEVASEVQNLILFFELELGRLSPQHITDLTTHSALTPYQYTLKQTSTNALYHLSEKEEQLINLKDLTGIDSYQNLYNDLTSSYQFTFELDGTLQSFNGSQLRALRQHADPAVRKRAMETFFKRYESDQLILAHTYNQIVKDCHTERTLRGYASDISVKNISNDLSDACVELLHDVTTQSYSLVQRYYKLKASLLNLPSFGLSDIYAPLPGTHHTYSWEDTKTLVLDSFKGFDPEIFALVQKMFDKKRIDAPVTPTKRGGAFCSSSTPDKDPYVLLNFLGRARDVSTLSHELGHAVHDMLCAKQPLSYYHPILPLAETASVFSEMILTDYLLKQAPDKDTKKTILTEKLEDIFATSHRQNMFSRFEISTHQRIGKGLLSADELCQIYQQELHLMFGNSVIHHPEYQWEWAAIPHIYESPFYVYAYNFGNLLVMALYQLYLEQGDAFIPKYKAFLSMGSCASPNDIAKVLDIDFESRQFWDKSLAYIDNLLAQLHNLCQ